MKPGEYYIENNEKSAEFQIKMECMQLSSRESQINFAFPSIIESVSVSGQLLFYDKLLYKIRIELFFFFATWMNI